MLRALAPDFIPLYTAGLCTPMSLSALVSRATVTRWLTPQKFTILQFWRLAPVTRVPMGLVPAPGALREGLCRSPCSACKRLLSSHAGISLHADDLG